MQRWMIAAAATAMLAAPALARPAVTRDMAKAHDELMFDIGDANHDGVLTRAEMEASLGVMNADPAGKARAEQMFDAVDPGHTGQIGKQQFVAEALSRFDRADANHDGVLDDQERLAAKAAIAGGMMPGQPTEPR